jgi:5-methyltetrahydrofolate--homocysteine methyltransferase
LKGKIMSIKEIYNRVIEGDADYVQTQVGVMLEEGVPAGTILQEGLIAAMDEVGRRFEDGDFFVPEMLIAARAMQAGLKTIKPSLIKDGIKTTGKVALGTVKGDLHDIGKNLVAMMIEGAGYDVQDLGVDVAPETFVTAAQSGAQIVGISALLTTTMANMRQTIMALEEAGMRDKVKVIIGGAPVTQAFADDVGADAFAPDASGAARAIRQLMTMLNNE